MEKVIFKGTKTIWGVNERDVWLREGEKERMH